MTIPQKLEDFCFNYLFIAVNQKRDINFVQDILLALEEHTKLKIVP